MRRICYLMLMFIIGCTVDKSSTEEVVMVDFRASVTKSAVRDDSQINTVDLFLYREQTGALESHQRVESASLSVAVPKGIALSWVLICNAPEGCSPEQESRMEDNSSNSLVMLDHGTDTFSHSSQKSIKVSRVMSKVVLEKITPSEGFLRAYLSDVAATCPYLPEAAYSGSRYNVGGVDMSLNPFLQQCLVCHECRNAEFFCYPDPEGRTTLVVEIEAPYGVDSYRVPLPPLESNTTYIIKELVMESRGQVHFSVSVNPWEEVDSSCNLQ